MVISGHIVVMEKRVKVAELKAQLSAHLRTVRRGGTLTVCDRDTPVARLVPFRSDKEVLEVRKATRSLADVTLPPAPARPVDSLAVLLQLRQAER